MNAFAYVGLQIQNALAYIVKQSNSYYKFGEGDVLPNCIIKAVNNSGTARECVDKLQTFIYGNGFQDFNVATSEGNADETFNKVLLSFALHVSYSECVSARVVYNNAGEPVRIYPLSFQTLRRHGNNTFEYNPLMGERAKARSDTRFTKAFNAKESLDTRRERVNKQIKQYGEQFGDILYYFNKGAGTYYDIYPIPKYYSGIDDIDSDAAITRLELSNLKKHWRPQVIISTGPIDNETKDANGTTQRDRFDAAMKSFTGEEGKTILHLDGATNEAKPDVKVINTADLLDQTDKATDRIGRKVCRHMGVPPVVAGFATPGVLGNNQELLNTMALFKLTVIKRQDLIKEALNTVWPGQNFEIIPLEIWKPANETPKV